MKRVFFIILLSIIGSKGFSQLIIENDLTVPIYVCIGWEQKTGDFKGMETMGWYNIEPGQSANTGLNFSTDKNHFFYYAKTASGPYREVITGDINLLVDPTNHFTITNANLPYKKDEHPEYDWKPFKRKEVSFPTIKVGRIFTFKMTILDISDGY